MHRNSHHTRITCERLQASPARLAGENMAKIHIKLDMMANEMGANGTLEQL